MPNFSHLHCLPERGEESALLGAEDDGKVFKVDFDESLIGYERLFSFSQPVIFRYPLSGGNRKSPGFDIRVNHGIRVHPTRFNL